jgi:hypothetical protein
MITLNCPYYDQNVPQTLHDNPAKIKQLSIICDDSTYNYGLHGICNYDLWNEKVTAPCIIFKNIVDFTNLEYLNIQNIALETKYWVQFAINSKCLKELHIEGDRDSYDCFNFNEEAFESLLKIPTLEKVSLLFMSTNFFPKGSPTETGNEMMKKQSNVKDLYIGYWLRVDYMDGDFYNVSKDFSKSFVNNLGTFIHLEKLKFDNIQTKYCNRELNNVIKNCPKLKSIVNCDCSFETLLKLVEMPNMKSIDNFHYFFPKPHHKILLEKCDFSKLEYIYITCHMKPENRCDNDKLYSILKQKCSDIKSFHIEYEDDSEEYSSESEEDLI